MQLARYSLLLVLHAVLRLCPTSLPLSPLASPGGSDTDLPTSQTLLSQFMCKKRMQSNMPTTYYFTSRNLHKLATGSYHMRRFIGGHFTPPVIARTHQWDGRFFLKSVINARFLPEPCATLLLPRKLLSLCIRLSKKAFADTLLGHIGPYAL